MNIEAFEKRDMTRMTEWLSALEFVGLNIVTTKNGVSLIALVAADGDGWLVDGTDHEIVIDILRVIVSTKIKLYAYDAHAVAIAMWKTHAVWLRGLRDASLVLRVHEPDAKRFEMRDGYSAMKIAPELMREVNRDLRSALAAITGKKNTAANTTRDWADEAACRLPLRSSVLQHYVAATAWLAAEIADEHAHDEFDQIEQTVENLWRKVAATGYTVDTAKARALHSAQSNIRTAAARLHGIDLAEDTPATHRWLSRRGIEITDVDGDPSLSHKNYAHAVVPDDAQADFDEFVRVREASFDAGKLTEITKAQTNDLVFPHIDSYGAVTGRQAIRRPALQNLPEHLRPLMLAPEGTVLVGADLSHVEPSIAAALSGDQAFIDDVQPGRDPYLLLAETIWDESIVKADPRRQIAKRVLLASGLYGQGTASLAHELGISEREAIRVRDGIFTAYPRFARWRKNVVTDAKAGRELVTGYGRVLANPDPDEAYKSVNWIVQGTAADYFKRATIRTYEALGDLGSLYLPIHDELIVACAPQDAEKVGRILAKSMSGVLSGVEITADATMLGDRLGHA